MSRDRERRRRDRERNLDRERRRRNLQRHRHHIEPCVEPCIEPCADCCATPEKGLLTHQPGCPVGTGMDSDSADDRAWFENNDNDFRVRPMTWAERQTIAQAHGGQAPSGGRVIVHEVSPGVRVRLVQPSGAPGYLAADIPT
jgi:hypothetical protein